MTADNAGDAPAIEDSRQGGQAERAAIAIENAIVRGELAPGSRVHEPRLATQLGVSRGSIREALNRLEGKSLVVRTPNQGARVATLSPIDVIELFELREAVEGMACRLACENMTDAEIEALAKLLEKGAPQDNGGYFQDAGDRDFHFAIARGSGNKRVSDQICGEIYHLLRIYRFRSSTTPGRASNARAEHRRIVEALRERDPDKAEALMRLHIRRSSKNLQRTEFANAAAQPSVVAHGEDS